jgi:hypothetical protein
VEGTYAEPIYARTPENPPRCHVPLIGGEMKIDNSSSAAHIESSKTKIVS